MSSNVGSYMSQFISYSKKEQIQHVSERDTANNGGLKYVINIDMYKCGKKYGILIYDPNENSLLWL
jgi:hypothetical protein